MNFCGFFYLPLKKWQTIIYDNTFCRSALLSFVGGALIHTSPGLSTCPTVTPLNSFPTLRMTLKELEAASRILAHFHIFNLAWSNLGDRLILNLKQINTQIIQVKSGST